MPPRNLDAETANRLEKFEAAAARALKPAEWLTFADYPGLRLHRHGAARTWVYRYRSPVDGKLRQIRLGRWPATSWEKAVARWDELRHARDDGTDPQLDRRARRGEAREKHTAERAAKKQARVTVAKLVERYLADRIDGHRTESAAYKVRRMLESTLVDALGSRSATTITRAEAAAFLTAERKRAPSQAVLVKREAGAAWRHALAVGLLPEGGLNPWDAHRAKDLGLQLSPRTRVLNDAELAQFLSKLEKLPQPERDALHVTLLTGARSGEVCGIAAGDIADGVWNLSENKTDAPRDVVLPRQAREILERHPAGFGIAQPRLAAALREHGKAIGLKAFRPHDLRRSARTGLSRIGVRSEVAEAAIGHAPEGIEGVYNLHEYTREVGEALARWADHLDALRAPEIKPLRKSA